MKKLFLIFAIIGATGTFVANAVEEDWSCPPLPVGTLGIVGECRGTNILGVINTWCDTGAEGMGDCVVPIDPPELGD